MTTLRQRRKKQKNKLSSGQRSVYNELNKHYTKKQIKALLNTEKGGNYNRRKRRYELGLKESLKYKPPKIVQKPTKEEKAFYRAQYNRAAKKAQTTTSNKRFLKLEKESRYLKKWEKGRELVERNPRTYIGSKRVNKTLMGELIVKQLATSMPSVQIKGTRQQHDNYERYKKIRAVKMLIKDDVTLVEGLAKYGKMNKRQLKLLSPKEFKKYSAFKGKLSATLIKAGVLDIKDRFQILGSASKWQSIIDDLEEFLKES